MSPTGEVNYNSPSSLARIMSLYTGTGNYGKKASTKTSLMRESVDAGEGLLVRVKASDSNEFVKLRTLGLSATINTEQRINQMHDTRFTDELRPVPTLLRTKRSKRCRACRHILVKPEPKVTNTRYRIKLIALNYVPTMALRPLAGPDIPALDLKAMPPSKPLQLLLTLKNPMFDDVKVILATPAQTEGRFSSRITILCPQFEIGANTDVWDEALGDSKRTSRLVRNKVDETTEIKVAEAGKVWDRGRNWTTIVVEIVCARIECQEDDLEENEDVLEIPLFVRLEYEADIGGEGGTGGAGDIERREKRDLAYWTVLGVGRINSSSV